MVTTSVSTGGDTSDASNQPVTAAGRYEALRADRQPFLGRAREASELTIPSLMPPEGHTGATTLFRPYQSTGADGVNNLAAKLLLALFPPGTSFFKLTMDDFVLDELRQNAQGEDAKGKFDEALGRVERAVLNRMEQKGNRKHNFEALQHLIVCGNGLVRVNDDGSEKFFPLDRYVVCRDSDGHLLEIVVKECVAKSSLSSEVREIADKHSKENVEGKKLDETEVEVYTWVERDALGWTEHQEVCGEIVPESQGSYPLDKCAWLALRWTQISGENYGRGRCEEYIGDLSSFEALSKALVQFAAAASKIIPLVNESGVTDREELARAKSGDFVEGDAKDVTFLMVDKTQDFNVTHQKASEIKAQLERAFLMASSVQRQAERVTAEEIRLMAGELEKGLGGVYSVLSEEFQRPLVVRMMHVMGAKGDIPKLPKNTVSPQIVTGLDGLGRDSDMQRLDSLIAGAAEQFGPQAVSQYINVGAYLNRRAAALGIDVTGLIRTDQEIAQMNQQQTVKDLAGKLGGPAIKAMSDQSLARQEQQSQQAQPTQE